MSKLRSAILVFGLWSIFGMASGQPFRGPDGLASPASDSRKVVDGFSAMLLVTPDMDWAEKWDTPPDVVPGFLEADSVARDQRLAILIFFANPALVQGSASTVVRLRVVEPDGNVQIDEEDAACFTGPLGGDRANVRLCETSLGYIADPDDLSGRWTVEVVIKDRNRGVEIPLRTSFQVLGP